MADSGESVLEAELETLEAIYIHELTCTRKKDGTVDKISVLLHPATGHDTRKQYVCMTLVLRPGPKYPDEPPDIQICNPRGLGEEEMASLFEALMSKAEEIKGEVMLYTLIEMAKDSLTDGNIPRCPCCVCLEHFDENDCFHRTACYHYFHTSCLHKYVQHTQALLEEEKRDVSERRHLDGNSKKERGIACPMCRSPLEEADLQVVTSGKVEDSDEKLEVFIMPPELREQQRKMAEVYQRQKARGGIIDPEVEKNKFLVNQEERQPVLENLENLATTERAVDLLQPVDPQARKEEKPESRGGDRGKGRARGRHHHGGYFGNKQRKVHSAQGPPREVLVSRDRDRNSDRAQQDGMYQGRYDGRAGRQERFSNSGGGGQGRVKTDRSSDEFSQGIRGGYRGEHEVDGQGGTEELRARRRDYSGEGKSKDRELPATVGCGTDDSTKVAVGSAEITPVKMNYKPHGDDVQSRGDHRHEHRNSSLHQKNYGFGSRRGYHESRAGSGRQEFKENISNRREEDATRERKQNNPRIDEKDGGLLRDEQSVKGTNVKTKSPDFSNHSESKTSVHTKSEGNFRSGGPKLARGEPVSRKTYDKIDDTVGYKSDSGASPTPSCDRTDDETKQGGFADDNEKSSGPGGRDRKSHGASGKSSYPRRSNYRQEGHRQHEYYNHQRHEQWRHQDWHGYARSRPGRGDDRQNPQRDDVGASRKSGETQLATSGENSGPTDPQDDEKADLQAREINDRWRQLNFGRSFIDKNNCHSGDTCPDDNDKLSMEFDGAACGQTDDLDMYYIGYRDMITQEESWDDEIDPYSTERLRIKDSDLKEYDRLRAKDLKVYRARLKRRVAMERVVLEEERRLMKEESQRRETSEETLKEKDKGKSVLELFKEKQNKRQQPEISAQTNSGDGKIESETESRPLQSLNSAEAPRPEKGGCINTDISQIKWIGKKNKHQKKGKSLSVSGQSQQMKSGRSHDERDSHVQAGRPHDDRDSHIQAGMSHADRDSVVQARTSHDDRNSHYVHPGRSYDDRNSHYVHPGRSHDGTQQVLTNGLQSDELIPTTQESYLADGDQVKGGSVSSRTAETVIPNSASAVTSLGVSSDIPNATAEIKATKSRLTNFTKPPPLKFSKKKRNETTLGDNKYLELNPLLPAPLSTPSLSTMTSLSTTFPLPTTLPGTKLSNDPGALCADSIFRESPALLQALKDLSMKSMAENDLALGHMMALNQGMALGHVTQYPSHFVAPPQSVALPQSVAPDHSRAPANSGQLKKIPNLAPLSFKNKTKRSEGNTAVQPPNCHQNTGQPFAGPEITGLCFAGTQITDVTNKTEKILQCLDQTQDHGSTSNSNSLRSHKGIHDLAVNGSGLNMNVLSSPPGDMDSLKENVCLYK